MSRLLVVFHTPTASTNALARAVLEGATRDGIEGVEVRSVAPLQAGPDDVRSADAIVLGTTENFGYMSGALKDFFDRTYYEVLGETQGLPYGLVVKAKLDDGSGTQRSIEPIVTGLGWRRVAEPVVVVGEVTDEALDAARELGAAVAGGLSVGLW